MKKASGACGWVHTSEPMEVLKSVSRRLICSLSHCSGGEGGLLVTIRTTWVWRRRVWRRVVSGRVIVSYANFIHSQAVSSKCEHGKQSPGGRGEEGEGHDCSSGICWDEQCFSLRFWPQIGQDTETHKPQKRPHTRENKITQDDVFSVFGIADLGEVGIQHNKRDAGQESQNSNTDRIVTSAVALIEHAFSVITSMMICVALIDDGSKYHNGEELGWKETK